MGYDLIVIGAGPAGMSAAALAAEAGLAVLLLDENPRAGGQIYRDLGQNTDRRDWLGPDYRAGLALIERLADQRITCKFGASVWRVDANQDNRSVHVCWSQAGDSHQTEARHLLIATGAQERPTPFPGWTLPGVMPAGAAQILMKNAGLLPRDAVLAGAGPLLYLVAAQMIAAGHPPKALVETQGPRDMLAAARHVPQALFASRQLLKGVSLLRQIRRAGVPRYTNARNFRVDALADDRLRFSFTHRGKTQALTCGLVLTHQGVIPSTHLSRACGILHVWDNAQRCLRPQTDPWGATDLSQIHIAGDGAGILGAEAAALRGRLAARDILHQLGRISADQRDQGSAADIAALHRASAIRPLLDRLYPPPSWIETPPEDTIVCRCEALKAGPLRQAITEGATGHRQLKTATRLGMGRCQGRQCDATARALLVEAGHPPVEPPRARHPVKPVTLGELARLDPSFKG